MVMPQNPKIYHIVHIDRLEGIVRNQNLFCDAHMRQHTDAGTTIGMSNIKYRRLNMPIPVHPQLMVGECVPFYFCPRSVMLFMIHRSNHPDLPYQGGQGQIIHLQADLYQTIKWAEQQNQHWAFTLSNAGSGYFEARNNTNQLHELDWEAINATQWQSCKEGKQAEFLLKHCFPWELIESIGVRANDVIYSQVTNQIEHCNHKPSVQIQPNWYY